MTGVRLIKHRPLLSWRGDFPTADTIYMRKKSLLCTLYASKCVLNGADLFDFD